MPTWPVTVGSCEMAEAEHREAPSKQGSGKWIMVAPKPGVNARA
jgi:hypothetical protein